MTSLPPGRQGLGEVQSALELWPNRKLLHIRRPRFWRFALPPDVYKDSRHPDFERFKKSSLVSSSNATVDGWLDAAQPFSVHLQETADNSIDPVLLSEADSWKKLCVQKGVQTYWYVPAIAPKGVNERVPDSFRLALKRVLSEYRRVWDLYNCATNDVRPEPSLTNSGYPLFTTHPMAKLGGACLWRRDWIESFDLARRWATWMMLPEDIAFGYGLSGRSGPGYKWSQEWALNNAEWLADHEIRGYSQRNRVIQMSPYATNRLLRPIFMRLHEPRHHIRGLWRTRNEDAQLHMDGDYHYEGDISGFDTSVSFEGQTAFTAEMNIAFPEAMDSNMTWLACEQRPLLCPSFRRKIDECTASFNFGGISSGGKATSGFGTVFNVAATVEALHEQGFDMADWPNYADARVSVQGDDVRISTLGRPLDVEAFSQSFAKLGLKCELRPGYVFLAKHLSPGGRVWPLAGRLVQQTMSNEHEPTSPYALGILQVGFKARFEQWSNVPVSYQAEVWKVIRHAEWIRDTSATSVNQLLNYLDDPAQLAVQKEALESTEGKNWLANEERHADSSMTAQDIMRLAARLGCTAAEVLAQDRVIEKLANEIHQLSTQQAWDLLRKVTEAVVLGGGPRLDNLLADYMKGQANVTR